MKPNKIKLKKTLATLLMINLLGVAQASMTFTSPTLIDNNIVDDRTDALATTHSGTWSESDTGATGTWSLMVTYTTDNSTVDLTWEVGAGNSVAIGSDPTGEVYCLTSEGLTWMFPLKTAR